MLNKNLYNDNILDILIRKKVKICPTFTKIIKYKIQNEKYFSLHMYIIILKFVTVLKMYVI